MTDEEKDKLFQFAKSYAFLSYDASFIASWAISKAEKKGFVDSHDTYVYATKILKKFLRKEIREQYEKNPMELFKNCLNDLSGKPSSYQFSVFSSILSSIEPMEEDCYARLLREVPKVKALLQTYLKKYPFQQETNIEEEKSFPPLQKLASYYVSHSFPPKKEFPYRFLTFYEFLDKYYTEEEQNLILSLLTQKERMELKKRYGEDWNSVLENVEKSTIKTTNYILYKTLPNIVKNKCHCYHLTNCFLEEYLTWVYGCSKEEILAIKQSFSEEEINLLQKRYGPNLDSYIHGEDKELTKLVQNVLQYRISSILKARKVQKRGEKSSLEAFLKTRYTEEEVSFIYQGFSSQELELLQKQYSSGFAHPAQGKMTKEERKIISHLLYYSIPQRIALKRGTLNEQDHEVAYTKVKKHL